jgi:hypothetical protein
MGIATSEQFPRPVAQSSNGQGSLERVGKGPGRAVPLPGVEDGHPQLERVSIPEVQRIARQLTDSSPWGIARSTVNVHGKLPGIKISQGSKHRLQGTRQGHQHQGLEGRVKVHGSHDGVYGLVGHGEDGGMQGRAQLVVPFLAESVPGPFI